jgi:hypothetical protein
MGLQFYYAGPLQRPGPSLKLMTASTLSVSGGKFQHRESAFGGTVVGPAAGLAQVENDPTETWRLKTFAVQKHRSLLC